MKVNNLTYGVIITRCQPLHQGHIDVIKKALHENDRCLVVIGSADKAGTKRNPFNIEQRMDMFFKLRDYLSTNRLILLCLDDWSCDSDIPYASAVGSTNSDYKSVNHEWGYWLYYNIVNVIKRKDFTLYYNDDPSIVEAWFPDYIRSRVAIKSGKRSEYASSIVRQNLLAGNKDYLAKAMPYVSEEYLNILSTLYENLGGLENA
jgi:cytidyltransferase-like protein